MEYFIMIYIIIENKKITDSSIFYILYYRNANRKKVNKLSNKTAHFCSENST